WIPVLLVTMGPATMLGAQTPTSAATGTQVQVPVVTTADARVLAPTVTLAEALRLAAEHSPQLVQAQGSVRTARAGERTVTGSYLPTLALSSTGTRSLNGQSEGLSGATQVPTTVPRQSNVS